MNGLLRLIIAVVLTLAAYVPVQLTIGFAIGVVCIAFSCNLQDFFTPMVLFGVIAVSLGLSGYVGIYAST